MPSYEFVLLSPPEHVTGHKILISCQVHKTTNISMHFNKNI